MYDKVITLLSIVESQNDMGDLVEEITEKNVFADVKSVGMRETYEANIAGLKPEMVFVLADYLEYSGQEHIKYDSVRYYVLRTYCKDTNELEIVVTR